MSENDSGSTIFSMSDFLCVDIMIMEGVIYNLKVWEICYQMFNFEVFVIGYASHLVS
jgi:hypothetical protein